MKNKLFATLALAFALLLCACANQHSSENLKMAKIYTAPTTSSFATEATLPTLPETTAPEVSTPTTSAPDVTWEDIEPPAPSHSELYLPECSQQQMQEYFEEVVLHMEYSDGTGVTSLVQKWLEPLCYRIYGSPTREDIAVLEALFTQLNEIPGFPGIFEASDDTPENLTIHFMDADDFRVAFADCVNGEDAYGATQFWYYTATNEIYTANVGYRTDLDQLTRTSILLEEIINMLGISDTVLRTDSIVYQYSNDNTALSDVDWVIVKLLYNSAIECGMNADDCSAILQELYY